MVTTADRALRWLPRVLGLLAALYLAVFALDAFGEGQPAGQALAGFALHLLPAVALLALVALAWRRAWVGALGFLALAAGYAVAARGRPDWILAVSGPLALVGVLYLASGMRPHDRVTSR